MTRAPLSRIVQSRFVGGIVIALVASVLAVTPTAATAVPSCATAAPDNFETAGTTMAEVWWAAGPVGTPVIIQVPDLCVGSDAAVTVDSNAVGVLIDVVGDGTSFATITLTPPAVDYTGVAQVDLTVDDGSVSFSLELYGLFGVDPTSFGYERIEPVAVAAGAPGFFSLPPITPRDGAVLRVEIRRSTAPVTVELVDSPSTGVVVTPGTSAPQTIGVDLLVTDGITSIRYQVFLWSGLPIPTGAVWAPNPPPVAIEPGGIGYFDLSGSFVPFDSKCEIKVMAEPDVELAVEPPSLQGVSFAPVGIEVKDPDFVGVLSVSYDLSCVLPDDSTSGFDYTLVLYVGVPIPELAATGSSVDATALLGGMLGLTALGMVLVGAGRTRVRRSS
jgi:hypothetical protein